MILAVLLTMTTFALHSSPTTIIPSPDPIRLLTRQQYHCRTLILRHMYSLRRRYFDRVVESIRAVYCSKITMARGLAVFGSPEVCRSQVRSGAEHKREAEGWIVDDLLF
jgi:hypothetical protein